MPEQPGLTLKDVLRIEQQDKVNERMTRKQILDELEKRKKANLPAEQLKQYDADLLYRLAQGRKTTSAESSYARERLNALPKLPTPTALEKNIQLGEQTGVIQTPEQKNLVIGRGINLYPGPAQPENLLDVEYKQTRNKINKLRLEEKKKGKQDNFDIVSKKLIAELNSLSGINVSGKFDPNYVKQRAQQINSYLQSINNLRNMGIKSNNELNSIIDDYEQSVQFLMDKGISQEDAEINIAQLFKSKKNKDINVIIGAWNALK